MKVVVLGLVLVLGGCQTVSISDLTARAKQIQDYTRFACSFVPTIATILAILSKGATSSVGSIATDICAAVTTRPLADGPRRRAPMVYGVTIRGEFVK